MAGVPRQMGARLGHAEGPRCWSAGSVVAMAMAVAVVVAVEMAPCAG